jgi:hypothetical protein
MRAAHSCYVRTFHRLHLLRLWTPTILLLITIVRSCPDGWHPLDVYCLFVENDNPKSYGDAEAECEAIEAKLLELTSLQMIDELESNFTAEILNSTQYYIGLNDLKQEGRYRLPISDRTRLKIASVLTQATLTSLYQV